MKTILKKSICLALLLVYARCQPGTYSNTSDSSIKKYTDSPMEEPSTNNNPEVADSMPKWFKSADQKYEVLEKGVKRVADEQKNTPNRPCYRCKTRTQGYGFRPGAERPTRLPFPSPRRAGTALYVHTAHQA